MSNIIIGVLLFVLPSMLIVYALYFMYLYRYMSLLKSKENILWHSYRESAGIFESEIYTAFRVLRSESGSGASNDSAELRAIGRMARVCMYSGMVLFLIMIVLLLTIDAMIV